MKMKMVAGLMVVLVAAFALPSAFASFETKDFITRGAYENLVKSGAIEGITMTKTIVSSPILEEALVAYSNHKLGGGTIFDCGETCLFGKCYTPGCSCGEYKVCYGTNSLEQNSNKAGEAARLEAALVTFAKKGLGGLPICGETCFQGTCNTPGCTCNWPVCEKNALAI